MRSGIESFSELLDMEKIKGSCSPNHWFDCVGGEEK